MKQLAMFVVGIGFLFSGLNAQTDTTMKTEKAKVSYIIGTDIGKNLKKQSIDVDPDLLFMGIKDGLMDNKLLLPDSVIQTCMAAFQQEMMAKQTAMSAKLAEKNMEEGKAFLEANKKRDSVVTLPSGLQYKILVKGTGKTPSVDDTVTTHYKGMLIDGTEFDNSYKRGEPATFPVKGVIPGWTEALQLMPVGSKWELFIPSELAYGERGAGQVIGPNSTLIFEVELLSISK